MKYDNPMPNKDGWLDWEYVPTENVYVRCCDCKLVHHYQFRIQEGRIIWRARRDERKTAASRRKR